MDIKLEVVILPVANVDRAKQFYKGLGWREDIDLVASDDFRIVQFTPPGSGCSVVIGKGAVPDMRPGSLQGLQLVVADIRAAHAQLVARGVEVTEVRVYGQEGLRPARDGDALDNVGFCFFSDPDGNGWAVQQISSRG